VIISERPSPVIVARLGLEINRAMHTFSYRATAGGLVKMINRKTTHDALEQLTPREARVLRIRFGIIDEDPKSISTPPPKSDEEDGSGGVPSPAKPPS